MVKQLKGQTVKIIFTFHRLVLRNKAPHATSTAPPAGAHRISLTLHQLLLPLLLNDYNRHGCPILGFSFWFPGCLKLIPADSSAAAFFLVLGRRVLTNQFLVLKAQGFLFFLTLPTLCSSWESWLGTTGSVVNVTTCMKLSSSEPLVPRYADDVKLFVKLFEWDGLYSPLAWGLGSPPRWARSEAQGLSADGDPWCQGVKGQLMEEAGGSLGSWVSPVQNHVNSRAEESSNLAEKTATWMANANKKPLLALACRSTGDRKRIGHGRKATGGTCCCCCCCNQGDSSKNVMKPTDFFCPTRNVSRKAFWVGFFCTCAEGFNTFRADGHLMDQSTRNRKACRTGSRGWNHWAHSSVTLHWW